MTIINSIKFLQHRWLQVFMIATQQRNQLASHSATFRQIIETHKQIIQAQLQLHLLLNSFSTHFLLASSHSQFHCHQEHHNQSYNNITMGLMLSDVGLFQKTKGRNWTGEAADFLQRSEPCSHQHDAHQQQQRKYMEKSTWSFLGCLTMTSQKENSKQGNVEMKFPS